MKVSNLFNVEPYINMEFNEDPIVYGAFADYKGRAYEGRMRELFELREQGDIALSEAYKNSLVNVAFLISSSVMKIEFVIHCLHTWIH